MRMAWVLGLLAAVTLGVWLVPMPVWLSLMARFTGSSAQQASRAVDAQPPDLPPRAPTVTSVVLALRLKEGDKALRFSLKDTQGHLVELEKLLGDLPIVIEFGSRTCDACLGQVEAMNRLAQRYQGKAKFLFIYCREAHPDQARISQSEDDETFADEPARLRRLRERQDAAKNFCSLASKDWTVLVDDVAEQSVYHRFVLGLGNPLFVLDRDGRIALAMEWTDAVEVEKFLQRSVIHH